MKQGHTKNEKADWGDACTATHSHFGAFSFKMADPCSYRLVTSLATNLPSGCDKPFFNLYSCGLDLSVALSGRRFAANLKTCMNAPEKGT